MADPRNPWDQTERGLNPYIQKKAPASNVMGPFEVLENSSFISLATFPYRDVKGGNLTVNVVGSAIAAAGNQFQGSLIADIQIIGYIQGVPSILKQGVTTFLTGPIVRRFETWDLYDTIEIRARNMSSGSVQAAQNLGNTTAAGASLQVTITLQPQIEREGPYA